MSTVGVILTISVPTVRTSKPHGGVRRDDTRFSPA
jgi:hypothetical protein